MRISTTSIESFRLWSDPEQEWMTEDELIASIRGEFVPTPAVRLGSAFGKVLETPDLYVSTDGFECGSYVFPSDVMLPALALMDHERGVFEAKSTRQYGDCTVVAKADQLVGARLIEHKTTLGYFDFDKYAESYQWRFMADIFRPVSVTYHVFLLSDITPDVDHEARLTFTNEITLRGIETFTLYPYPALHDDCAELVRTFAEYVTLRGLDGLLRERQRAA